MVAKRRTVVTFRLVLGPRVKKVSTVTGIGGVVVAKPRTVVTFRLVSFLRVSKVSTVTGIGGVVVAKPRTVVTFRLVSGLRVSKVSTVTGIGGLVVAKRRTVVTFRLVSVLRVSNSEKGTRGEKSDKRRGERDTWQPCAQSFECRPRGVVLLHVNSRDFLRILPGVLKELIHWPNCGVQSSRLEAWPNEGFCVRVVPWSLRWLRDWLQAAISASFRLGFS